MPQITLSETELAELINTYESSLRKLYFQVQMTEHTIQELKQALHDLQPSKPEIKTAAVSAISVSVVPPPTVADAPAEEEEEETGTAEPVAEAVAEPVAAPVEEEKPARKKRSDAGKKRGPKGGGKKKKTGGRKAAKKGPKSYRLSEWDQFVLDTLAQQDKLLTKADLDTFAEKWVVESGMDISAEDRYNKIARVLHKLANSHGRLKKEDAPGRGFYYSLPEWYFASSGELKNKYKKQLEPEVA